MPESSTNTTGSILPGRRSGSIGARLLLAFVLLVLLPVVILSLVLIISNVQGSREQLQRDLDTALAYKEAAIDEWLSRLEFQINNTALGLASQSDVQIFLHPDTVEPEAWTAASNHLQDYLRQVAGTLDDFDELIWLDQSGRVLLATGATQVGANLSGDAFFLPNATQAMVPPPVYSRDLGYVSFFAVTPLRSASGEQQGLLVARVNKMPLNVILLEQQGLGDTGETFLVGQGYLFLNKPRYPTAALTNKSAGALVALDSEENGSGTYSSYRWGEGVWRVPLAAAAGCGADC